MKNKIIIPTFLFIIVLFSSFFIIMQEKNDEHLKTEEIIEQENELNNTDQEEINNTNETNNKNQTEKEINNTPKEEEYKELILFYGDGCPHCVIVENYLEENKINEKIYFVKKEVYYNQNNAKDLQEKAKICGLPTNSIGVPFLWNGKACLLGSPDIINFFKQIINN